MPAELYKLIFVKLINIRCEFWKLSWFKKYHLIYYRLQNIAKASYVINNIPGRHSKST